MGRWRRRESLKVLGKVGDCIRTRIELFTHFESKSGDRGRPVEERIDEVVELFRLGSELAIGFQDAVIKMVSFCFLFDILVMGFGTS